MMRCALCIAIATLSALFAATTAGGSPAAPTRLAPSDSTGIAEAHGSVAGDAHRDHSIRVGAGQTLTVDLEVSSPSAYFNVLPPGSSDVAMFIGSTSGSRFRGIAPIAGDYVVRVYLMRSAARRGASATFTLHASVTGTALVPLAPSKDARIPGTPFHATATVRCTIPYQPEVHACGAWVVRYDRVGTATVELRGPGGFVRRILLVKGTPTASDATEPPASTHAGDTTTVRIGADESYDLPDALILGG